MMEPTYDASAGRQTEEPAFNLRRFLGLASALACAFFYAGFAATRYSHPRMHSPQDISLRGQTDTGLDKTLLSSKSFKNQAIDLGFVVADESNGYKQVTVEESPSVEFERAPKHHKPREYHLVLEDDNVDSQDVEAALSKALRNGKEGTDEIAVAVSKNLHHHMNFDKNAPSKDETVEDKP
jgi:hypothetical protein